ncbi:MAG TPA: GAP family protein [Ilumatobacter sp.]
MSLLTLLPMAFIMIAGPQVLSAVFLATSEGWRRNSAAFIVGAALSISLIVTAAFLLGSGAKDQGASDTALYVAALVLLLLAMLRTYLKRGETEPPKWMGRLQSATPRFSFTLGFLLLGVFPTDILTSVAIGTYLSAHHEPLWHGLAFLALTLLLLAIPSLALLAFGTRGEAFLPKVRDWMTTSAWIVNEVVLLFFVAIVVSDLA